MIPATESDGAMALGGSAAGGSVAEVLRQSSLFGDYARAFRRATGWEMDLLAGGRRGLSSRGGMEKVEVPVAMGDEIIGHLEAVAVDSTLGATDRSALRSMMELFAQHLCFVGNQILLEDDQSVTDTVARAKQFIRDHHREQLTLDRVAGAMNMSRFYFCKIFRKQTGLHFTDYVSRVRVEKAKELLLNPNMRISEVAYEVGFQSITHFNRVFKRVSGQSPTAYRESAAGRFAA